MTRRSVVVALILVAAFLLHDGWMAHAGHVVYPDAAASRDHGMHDSSNAHQHTDMASASTGALVSPDVVVIPEPPVPNHDTCMPLRIGAPNPDPGITLVSDVLAIFPMPAAHTETGKSTSTADTSPVLPPDVRRALLQVFLI